MIQSRWPVHPGPLETESLSSWLRRLAMIYRLTVKDLVQHALGFSRRQRERHWLDIDPPDKLLKAVSARTGIPLERVQRTTIGGVRPLLYAYFDRNFSGNDTVLMAQPKPPQHRQLQKWILRHELTNEFTGCRLCLDGYPNAGVLLPWRLKIITSCPVHGIMLEPVRIIEDTPQWGNDGAEEAPEVVHRLDCRSWQALTSGYVSLPGGLVQADLWFRLLRILWDELNKPFQECREQPVLSVRNAVDRFFQMAKDAWWLSSERRHAILVASAIEMMEKGIVFPEGVNGKYFAGKGRETLSSASLHNDQKQIMARSLYSHAEDF